MALHLPAEFENYMKTRLGPAFPDFQASLEQPPPVSIRYNPHKSSSPPGEVVVWCDAGRYLSERPSFTLDPRLHAGMYYVQEASSMFLEQGIRQSVDLTKPLNVLDLCAAPGGKSTHILSLISPESLLISNEVIRSRASILSENLQKWGNENVIVTNSDPADFQKLPAFFDLIVMDAPCSGEGLFRKDPEAIKEWSPKNAENCTLRQRRIVSDVWPSLKPGGVLIYSTCTYNENENIENLVWLQSQQEFEFVKLEVDEKLRIEEVENRDAIGYQLYPHRVKGEGFFMSVLRKKGNHHSSLKTKDTLNYPTKSQVKELSAWMKSPETQCFFLHNQTVRIFPAHKITELQIALNRLNVLTAGTAVAEIMRNKMVPDHAFALSTQLKKGNFNCVPLEKNRALEYLRKNNFDLDLSQTGFSLIEFEGLPLGWVNILPNRFNNLYPANWRIRMN